MRLQYKLNQARARIELISPAGESRGSRGSRAGARVLAGACCSGGDPGGVRRDAAPPLQGRKLTADES
eukprot:957730-Rhodomonas_salina.1